VTISRGKLIEVALPLEATNEEGSQRKRMAPAGYPTSLHNWWAQRPLAVARAVIFAQMVDDPSSSPDLFPREKAQEKEHRHLLDVDVVRAGGWKNTVRLKTAYQQTDPETILKVVPEAGELRVAKGGSPVRSQQRARPVGCTTCMEPRTA